jgi:hypothetical protein
MENVNSTHQVGHKAHTFSCETQPFQHLSQEMSGMQDLLDAFCVNGTWLLFRRELSILLRLVHFQRNGGHNRRMRANAKECTTDKKVDANFPVMM